MGGVLAIDHGERKTGIAYTDGARILSSALEPLPFGGLAEELFAGIAGLLEERDVAVLLVGLPLSPLGGHAGERARSVQAFARELEERHPGCRIVLHDEHLTTKEAESRLSEAGFRGKKRKARKDSWSALVLLEDWIAAGEPMPEGGQI